jgi:hypothetical protein
MFNGSNAPGTVSPTCGPGVPGSVLGPWPIPALVRRPWTALGFEFVLA